MLTSPSARPSSTDFNFFSGSKPITPPSSLVTETTRFVPRRAPSSLALNRCHDLTQNIASSNSLPHANPVSKQKRKLASSDALPSQLKRLRTTDPPQKRSSSATPSRGSSRPRTLAPSPEPIYRSSRSHSMLTCPHADSPTPRQYWIEEGGEPGRQFISSELVVKSVMRSYKACLYFHFLLLGLRIQILVHIRF